MAEHQYIAVRALNRSPSIRVKDNTGAWVKLSSTSDTIIDLNDPANRRALAHHGSIGQYVVTATNPKVTNSSGVGNQAFPANTAT